MRRAFAMVRETLAQDPAYSRLIRFVRKGGSDEGRFILRFR